MFQIRPAETGGLLDGCCNDPGQSSRQLKKGSGSGGKSDSRWNWDMFRRKTVVFLDTEVTKKKVLRMPSRFLT